MESKTVTITKETIKELSMEIGKYFDFNPDQYNYIQIVCLEFFKFQQKTPSYDCPNCGRGNYGSYYCINCDVQYPDG